MQAAEREQYLARLRQLVNAGASLRAAAAELQRPKTTVQRWAKAAGIAGQQTRLSLETRASIDRRLRQGQTIYAIAKVLGVSTRTVWERYMKRLREVLGVGPLPCAEWRCPECGAKLNVNRCVLDGTRKPAKTKVPKSGPGKRPAPPR